MADLNDDLRRVVELALADDWEAAHQLVQQYESDTMAAWIHAVLHKMEGDLSNSRYWYHRANQMKHVGDEPRGELEVIQNQLRSSS